MAHHSIDIGMQNMYSKSFIWAFPIGSIRGEVWALEGGGTKIFKKRQSWRISPFLSLIRFKF